MATARMTFTVRDVVFDLTLSFAGGATSGRATAISGTVGGAAVTGLTNYQGGGSAVAASEPHFNSIGLSFATDAPANSNEFRLWSNGVDYFLVEETVDGASVTQFGNITYTAAPDSNPTAAPDSFTILEDSGTTFLDVQNNDSAAPGDGGFVFVSSVTQPSAGGTVTLSGAVVTFTAAPDFNGSTSFTYTIMDMNGGTATTTATVNVTAVNDAPVATDNAIAVTQRLSSSGRNLLLDGVPDSDVDGDALMVAAVSAGGNSKAVGNGGITAVNGAYGTLTISANGAYSYAALAEGGVAVGDTVTDTFSYTVSDGRGPTDEAQLAVTVTGSAAGDAGSNTFLLTGSGTLAAGGRGDDSYVVDSSDDDAVEVSGGGLDTVLTSVSYTLATGVDLEILKTTNVAGTNAIALVGNELANTIEGNAGTNTLNGGGGTDTMRGFAGDDIYFVDNAGDRIFEVAGAGNDRLATSVSYVLATGQSIETMQTTSAAGTAAINLTGNELVQSMIGNAGANRLNGGGGADAMRGFGGNDLYYVDNAGDRVIEAVGQGSDTVAASTRYTLQAGQSIEVLQTTNSGGTGAIDLAGNEIAQVVKGNNGTNVINGDGGSDVLYGYGGADTFVFDTAPGATNRDTIMDFSHAADTIRLDKSVFAALTVGTLAASAFKDIGLAGAMVDADDRILYNNDTGALFYNSDGSGAGAAVQFATLLTRPTDISHLDFVIVA